MKKITNEHSTTDLTHDHFSLPPTGSVSQETVSNEKVTNEVDLKKLLPDETHDTQISEPFFDSLSASNVKIEKSTKKHLEKTILLPKNEQQIEAQLNEKKSPPSVLTKKRTLKLKKAASETQSEIVKIDVKQNECSSNSTQKFEPTSCDSISNLGNSPNPSIEIISDETHSLAPQSTANTTHHDMQSLMDSNDLNDKNFSNSNAEERFHLNDELDNVKQTHNMETETVDVNTENNQKNDGFFIDNDFYPTSAQFERLVFQHAALTHLKHDPETKLRNEQIAYGRKMMNKDGQDFNHQSTQNDKKPFKNKFKPNKFKQKHNQHQNQNHKKSSFNKNISQQDRVNTPGSFSSQTQTRSTQEKPSSFDLKNNENPQHNAHGNNRGNSSHGGGGNNEKNQEPHTVYMAPNKPKEYVQRDFDQNFLNENLEQQNDTGINSEQPEQKQFNKRRSNFQRSRARSPKP